MAARIPFEALIAGIKTRDEDAIRTLYDQYTARLIAVVAGKMPAWLKAREGADDIAQTVLKTVVRRFEDSELSVDNDEGLWRLLVRIAVRKVSHRYRDQTTQKRGGGKERSLGTAAADEPTPADLAAAAGPTPDEEAEFADTVQWLMGKLPKAHHQAIVKYALQGYTREEIASLVGLEVRQVYRVLDDVKAKLAERAK